MIKSGNPKHSALVYAFGVGIEVGNQTALYALEVGNLAIFNKPVTMQGFPSFNNKRWFEWKCLNLAMS